MLPITLTGGGLYSNHKVAIALFTVQREVSYSRFLELYSRTFYIFRGLRYPSGSLKIAALGYTVLGPSLHRHLHAPSLLRNILLLVGHLYIFAHNIWERLQSQ